MHLFLLMLGVILVLTPSTVQRVQVWPDRENTIGLRSDDSFTLDRVAEGWCTPYLKGCIYIKDGQILATNEAQELRIDIAKYLTVKGKTNYSFAPKEFAFPIKFTVAQLTNETLYRIDQDGRVGYTIRVVAFERDRTPP